MILLIYTHELFFFFSFGCNFLCKISKKLNQQKNRMDIVCFLKIWGEYIPFHFYHLNLFTYLFYYYNFFLHFSFKKHEPMMKFSCKFPDYISSIQYFRIPMITLLPLNTIIWIFLNSIKNKFLHYFQFKIHRLLLVKKRKQGKQLPTKNSPGYFHRHQSENVGMKKKEFRITDKLSFEQKTPCNLLKLIFSSFAFIKPRRALSLPQSELFQK